MTDCLLGAWSYLLPSGSFPEASTRAVLHRPSTEPQITSCMFLVGVLLLLVCFMRQDEEGGLPVRTGSYEVERFSTWSGVGSKHSHEMSYLCQLQATLSEKPETSHQINI